MSPRDRYEKICERVRWSEALLNVLIADPDVQHIHCEALGGIAGHLADAQRELEELGQDLRHDVPEPSPEKKPRLVPIRKAAPADDEPEHAA